MPAYTPLGSEFRVNSVSQGDQYSPTITSLPGGGFVVCWTDSSGIGGDTSYGAIKAQIFSSNGTPLSGEILVNTITTDDQDDPTITGLAGGGFVVSWTDYSSSVGDTSGSAVKAQMFAADGSRIGGEILVNSVTSGLQIEPCITGLANGGFVVSWTDTSGIGGDSSGAAIKAQIFAPDGSRLGGEFLVNTETANIQDLATITDLVGGGFVVSWISRPDPNSSYRAIKAQIFTSDGSPVGGEFLVNTATAVSQFSPSITSLLGGGFVIAWEGFGNGDASSSGIRARIFAADGTPVADEFLVNTMTEGRQSHVTITGVADGGFVIGWTAPSDRDIFYRPDGIRAQAFTADGSRIGDELLVNTVTAGYQEWPTITGLAGGGFVVGWLDLSGGPAGNDIKAQIYSGNPGLDIEPLRLEANSAAFELAPDGLSASGVGTITIGRSDGIFPLLTAGTATGQYTATTASVTSAAFVANVGGVTQPLWGGNLVIDVGTQSGEIVDNLAPGMFLLAGQAITFQRVSILENSLGFDISFVLPDTLSGALIDSAQIVSNALVFDQNGVRFAPGFTVSVPDISFNLFGTIPAEISDFSLEYNGVENAIYLRSVIELGEIVNDQGTTIEADFTGTNFIRYGPNGLDAIITFDITTDIEFAGWGLQNLQVTLDTVKKEATGEVTISTPFGVQLGNGVDVTVGIGITYDPFYINSINIAADNLNRPVPGLPLYLLQSIGGSINNLAPTSTAPVVFSGSMGGTYGPQYQGNSLARLDLTGTISRDQMTGTAEFTMATVNFEGLAGRFSGVYSILEATGTGVLDWTRGTFSVDGNISILEGLFTVSSSLDIDRNWNASLTQQMAFAIPDWVPVFSGAVVSDGNLSLRFVNDGNFTNDYVMVWGNIEISKAFLGIPFVIDLTTGLRFGFDGSVSRVGVNDIPAATSANELQSLRMGQADPDGANAEATAVVVGAGENYILLAANWTNSSSDAQLVVTLPDGRVVYESEFEQYKIAIIEEFSNEYSRVAIVFDPSAGNWSVTAQSSVPLQGLLTNILEAAERAYLTIDEITASSGTELSIDFSAADPDSDAQITFWYSTSSDGSGGSLIGSASETESSGTIAWDIAALTPGQYYVYAVIEDGESAPVQAYAPTRIVIGEGQAPLILPSGSIRNDFNGDGRSDILWRNVDGQLSNWLGQANGGFVANNANAASVVPVAWQVAGTGDFNGDGRDDILWRNTDGTLSNWLGTAAGGYTPNDANAAVVVPKAWQVVGTGDFNGDGRDDILWRNTDGTVSNWLGTTAGGFTPNDANAARFVPTDWFVVGTGDFNGDGRDDILWRKNDGTLSNWLGQANGGFTLNDAVALTVVPTAWSVVGTGDFNGDGRDDILWRNTDGTLSNWLGQANGGFIANDANAAVFVPTAWSVVATGDFNGDGRDDILWRNTDGTLSNWLGTASGGFIANDANAATPVPASWIVQPEPFLL